MPTFTPMRGRDCTMSYKLGGAVDGSPSWDASATTYTCYVRSYSRETTMGTVEMGALCDTLEQHMPTRSSGTVTFEALVNVAAAAPFQDKEGYYIQTIFDSGTTIFTDYGMIESAGLSVDVDGMLIERVTVRLGVIGAAP